jgi:hypothetical protein
LLGITCGAEHSDRLAADVVAQKLDDLHRLRISPLQVVQHQETSRGTHKPQQPQQALAEKHRRHLLRSDIGHSPELGTQPRQRRTKWRQIILDRYGRVPQS